jgi:hypothetical protein
MCGIHIHIKQQRYELFQHLGTDITMELKKSGYNANGVTAMRDYEESVHLTTSQCWYMVTFLENFVVWTEDAVQLCIAE